MLSRNTARSSVKAYLILSKYNKGNRENRYLPHRQTQILISDVDTDLCNSNPTYNSCALTLSLLALPIAGKLSCTLLHDAQPYLPFPCIRSNK
jgi:hypothetical protein